MTAAADDLVRASRRVRDHGWESGSAEVYDGHRKQVVGGLDTVAVAAREISRVLDDIAGTLATTQRRLDREWSVVVAVPHTTLGTQGVLVFHEDSDDQRGQVQRATRTAQSIRTELDTTLEGLSGRLRAAHVELRRAADSAVAGSTGSGATGGIAAIAERISASAAEDLATSLREGSVSNVAGGLDAGAAYAGPLGTTSVTAPSLPGASSGIGGSLAGGALAGLGLRGRRGRQVEQASPAMSPGMTTGRGGPGGRQGGQRGAGRAAPAPGRCARGRPAHDRRSPPGPTPIGTPGGPGRGPTAGPPPGSSRRSAGRRGPRGGPSPSGPVGQGKPRADRPVGAASAAGRLAPVPETQQAPRSSTLDTVAVASGDPGRDQPWADLGLKSDEYDRIREILGRRPTSSELAMYSVMWSEHCSYKSSKVHLKQFSEIPQETPVGKMLAGIGENAGVLDIGQGYAVTFKVESHNHPSYVEPYQGAATGVGGIVRDILAMGARPVAVMDPLRFGPLDAPDTHRVLPGIVAGVGGYGNCLGLPNIGGEAVFDADLPRQPARQRALHRGAAPRGPPPRQGVRRRQPGHPVRRPHRRRRHRRRLRARLRDLRRATGPPSAPACRSATRSWRSCSSSAPSSSSPPASSPASRTSAAPGSPAPPPSWRAPATAACRSSSTGCRCATPRSLPRRS